MIDLEALESHVIRTWRGKARRRMVEAIRARMRRSPIGIARTAARKGQWVEVTLYSVTMNGKSMGDAVGRFER